MPAGNFLYLLGLAPPINALIYAEHDLRDAKLFRRLAQQAAESGQTFSCGNHLADGLVRKSFLGDPNGSILDEGVYVDLLECAAMHPETGTGEGSEAAESAFELGVYFSGRSEDSKAVFWWARAFELVLWEGAVAVGRCFLDGKGVGRDPLAAARWFMRESEIRSEPNSMRLFSDEWIPVEPGLGWVRNAALLAEIANLLPVEQVSMLSFITQGAVERLLVRTATYYVPKLSELDDDDFAE
jgi:hypothetical protein